MEQTNHFVWTRCDIINRNTFIFIKYYTFCTYSPPKFAPLTCSDFGYTIYLWGAISRASILTSISQERAQREHWSPSALPRKVSLGFSQASWQELTKPTVRCTTWEYRKIHHKCTQLYFNIDSYINILICSISAIQTK